MIPNEALERRPNCPNVFIKYRGKEKYILIFPPNPTQHPIVIASRTEGDCQLSQPNWQIN